MKKVIDNRLLQKGDERTWKLLFVEYYPTMCHLAFQYVHDSLLSEMLAGDVMFQVWEKRKDIDPSKPIAPYLYQSVRNRSIDYMKSFNVKNMQTLAEDGDVTSTDHPLGILLDTELYSSFLKAVDELPEESRKVFRMSREQELKYEEIAGKLGISVNTVKYHMKKALSLLREKLEKFL